jgi:DNA anti-recombination protein RmuC
MPSETLERLRPEALPGEDWADYRKLILTALTDLKESQKHITEKLARNQQLTAERLAEYQRQTGERLAESQRAMTDKIAEGLRTIGEKIENQLTELYSLVGDMRVKIAVLTVKIGIIAAVAGMVGGAVIAGLVNFMLQK